MSQHSPLIHPAIQNIQEWCSIVHCFLILNPGVECIPTQMTPKSRVTTAIATTSATVKSLQSPARNIWWILCLTSCGLLTFMTSMPGKLVCVTPIHPMKSLYLGVRANCMLLLEMEWRHQGVSSLDMRCIYMTKRLRII